MSYFIKISLMLYLFTGIPSQLWGDGPEPIRNQEGPTCEQLLAEASKNKPRLDRKVLTIVKDNPNPARIERKGLQGYSFSNFHFSAEEEDELFRRRDEIAKGKTSKEDPTLLQNPEWLEIRESLVLTHLGQAIANAKSLSWDRSLLEDAIQDAVIGLMEAFDAHQLGRGSLFFTTATFHTRKNVMLAKADYGVISIPDRFATGSGAGETRPNDAELERLARQAQHTITGDDKPLRKHFTTRTDNRDPMLFVIEDEISQRLKSVAENKLSPTERKVIELRFGLGEEAQEKMEFQAIADKLGDTIWVIKGIYRKAITKMLAGLAESSDDPRDWLD